ncbi:MAG: energy-coupling factor transporter transmembrane component T [Gemmatimonadota bacterium]|nr:energy-coupling factor transporter transmembrane component T [Gemmatimonadota bacterium]MYB62862.1 energy-coupling factor transporter transmembrane protein EcfT [Gemmatimonadota bacterium]
MVLYIPTDSLLHRLHPSTKIVGLALLLILTVAFQSPWYQLVILSGVLLLARSAGAFRNLRRILPLMITVLVFSVVSWSLFRRVGDPFWSFGLFTLSTESIRFGFAMGFRLEAMLVSGMVFVSCTKVEEFAYGLRTIGLPFAVSFALSLAFRLVPLFFTRISTVVQAQQARGLDLKSGNVLQRARKYVPLLVPIFVYAIRDTDLLSMALESKGFGMRGRRTEYLSFPFVWRDYAILGLLLILNIAGWLMPVP